MPSPNVLYILGPSSTESLSTEPPARRLQSLGCTVSFATFTDLTPSDLASYTHILCNIVYGYHKHVDAFTLFLTSTVPAARTLNPSLQILNPPRIMLWNLNKTYLQSLAPLPTPPTQFLPSTTSADELARALATQTHSIVLKPSISASNNLTHRVRHPAALDAEDRAFLETLTRALSTQNLGSIMLQSYLPGIASRGEYSLIFIAGLLTHAVIKRPRDASEFRVGTAYGGLNEVVDPSTLQGNAVEIAQKAFAILEEKAGGKGELKYLRLDGVVGDDGGFVIMEAECIEPYMWLDDEPDPEEIGREVAESEIALTRDAMEIYCKMIVGDREAV